MLLRLHCHDDSALTFPRVRRGLTGLMLVLGLTRLGVLVRSCQDSKWRKIAVVFSKARRRCTRRTVLG